MDKEEVKKLIRKGEGPKVEFKSRFSSFGPDVCAFANTDGGTIIFGINDDGSIKGILRGNEEKVSSVADKCSPPVRPQIKQFKIDNKEILVARIKNTGNLHSLSGRVYKRVGSTNRKLSSSEILDLGQKLEKIRFGEQICEGATRDDINEEKVRQFLTKTRDERNLDIDPQIQLLEGLEKLNLAHGGDLTNASVLMFGQSPQDFYPQAEVRCGRFKGNDASSDFVDMKVFSGPIYKMVDRAMQFVMEHIDRAARIIPGQTEREEEWEYPLEALREALTNAVVHRDYFSSSNVQVRIFDDRVEIWNPGTLPKGITVEDLKGKHESKPQNPLIAKLFFLIKYIEQWGTGTNRIVKLCEEKNLPEPEFEDTGSSFIVTLRKSKLTEGYLETLELNDRQRKAIEYVKENEQISNSKYRDLNDVTRETAKRDLADLVDKEILQQKGKGRATHYTF